jgi:hypothetical protein
MKDEREKRKEERGKRRRLKVYINLKMALRSLREIDCEGYLRLCVR